MMTNTNEQTAYPQAIPLSAVADPATLWALVLEGEKGPDDDDPEGH